jgi:cytochrome c nitrite reductase small subunit
VSRLRTGVFGLALTAALGVLIGVGTFTFYYAEGASYFSTDPSSCVNCHIMRPQYDSWHKSSHSAVAGCVDCHLPQNNIASNLIAKSDNGWRHSWAFTFQDFHEPIQITPRNARIVQENCLRCHEAIVHEMVTVAGSPHEVQCVHCHAGVGHGAR